MTNSNWTAGEWKPWRAPDGAWTVRTQYLDDRGPRITAFLAVCNGAAQDHEANCRLFAAAKNLYAALDALLFDCDQMQLGEVTVAVGRARAALAEAEGRAAP